MDVAKALGLVICLMLLSGVAKAETDIVSQTVDYSDDLRFYLPGDVLDHSPWYRGPLEDWGWTHDMTNDVPTNATGVDWATLWIDAWDVDAVDGEVDVISVNGVVLGALDDTGGRNWLTSRFTLPPSLLDELWQDGGLDVYIDIDVDKTGGRVTLGESVLTVAYNVGPIPEPATIGLLGLGGLMLLRRRRRRQGTRLDEMLEAQDAPRHVSGVSVVSSASTF